MTNNTQLHIQGQQFSLKRFPSNPFDKSLRAWDAADEYIIDHVASTFVVSELQHIVIINDGFGALTCAMARLAAQAKISVFTDSFMAQTAILQNLKGSNLDKNKVDIHNSLAMHSLRGQKIDLILLKVPRTLSYLNFLLCEVSQLTKSELANHSESSTVVAGAMVKLVTSSVMKMFGERLINTSSSLARKKARLIFSHLDGLSIEPTAKVTSSPAFIREAVSNTSYVNPISDTELDFTLYNYPNVFCHDQVDIGARYILKHLPRITKANQVIVDLGCGNGILGTQLLLANPQHAPKVIYIDESYMAIESAKETLIRSQVNAQSKSDAQFLVGHCLAPLLNKPRASDEDLGVNYVICNPPFHQQSTVIDDIAWQMFTDAKKVLKVGGELRIVGNRHLDHRVKLSKLFGACHVIASDKKFVVLSAIKQA